jgi:hypothetical protein
MKRLSLFLYAIVLVFGVVGISNATTELAGITFDDNAFVDTVISYYLGPGASPDPSGIIGSNLATTVDFFNPGEYVEVGFTDNFVVNGAGYDLTVFEAGAPELMGVSLTVSSSVITVLSVDTGYTAPPPGGQVNVAFIDLSDLGIPMGQRISSEQVLNSVGSE